MKKISDLFTDEEKRQLGLNLLCRRAFKALSLDLGLRRPCLLDSTRHGFTLFHDTELG